MTANQERLNFIRFGRYNPSPDDLSWNIFYFLPVLLHIANISESGMTRMFKEPFTIFAVSLLRHESCCLRSDHNFSPRGPTLDNNTDLDLVMVVAVHDCDLVTSTAYASSRISRHLVVMMTATEHVDYMYMYVGVHAGRGITDRSCAAPY